MRIPKVSLCMPVFNGSNFIDEALASISKQSFEDFELIVTDNASSDNTVDILRRWSEKDARFRYIQNEKNIGAAENYNLGYREARGKYIKWCAHDDVLDPKFLEALVSVLDSDPTAALAFCRTTNIDTDGEDIGLIGAELGETLDGDPLERFRHVLKNSVHCYPIFGLFRRDVLEETSLHRPYYSSDRALLAEVMILGKLRFAQGTTFYSRLHDDQSVKIFNRRERIVWQLGESSRFKALEKLNYYLHLSEISGRHGDLKMRRKLKHAVWRSALSPREASRIVFEIVQVIAPQLSDWIRITRRKFLARTATKM